MDRLSRSQTVGILALMVVITGGVFWGMMRTVQSASTSGINLREAFPQPPAAPPAVRPPDSLPSTASADPDPAVQSPATGASPAQPTPTPAADLVVHVAGAVRSPGVYHLRPGARAQDAVLAAGGPLPDANVDAINLAARVQDGTQIYVPTRSEQTEGGATADRDTASASAGGASPRDPSRSNNGSRSDKPEKLSDPSQGQVNLNTASSEELQRLPGIGPTMADRILAYRTTNGGFRTVEDLMQVSGIGQKKFEKLRPFLTVN